MWRRGLDARPQDKKKNRVRDLLTPGSAPQDSDNMNIFIQTDNIRGVYS